VNEIIQYDDDPEEWRRRHGAFDVSLQSVWEEIEAENMTVSTPEIMGPHGALMSLRMDGYPCSCYYGADCGAFGCSVVRTDTDGPFIEEADAWVCAEINPRGSELLRQEWNDRGRPRQSYTVWRHGIVDHEADEWDEHVRESQRRYDRVRRAARRNTSSV
jgi:hypothetical protein